MRTVGASRKWFPAPSGCNVESEFVCCRGQRGVVSHLDRRNPWSGPRGEVFWTVKSGRSLQRATRGGVCVRECVRVASPGSASVAAVCLHDEEILGSTGGTGRGLRETCFPTSLLSPFPRATFFARPMMLLSNLFPVPQHTPNLAPVLSFDLVPREVGRPFCAGGNSRSPGGQRGSGILGSLPGASFQGFAVHSAAPAGDAVMLPPRTPEA